MSSRRKAQAKDAAPEAGHAAAMASLRFLFASAHGAQALAQRHEKRHGAPSEKSVELFQEVAFAAREILEALGFALPWQRHWWRLGMSAWGRLSAYATRKFCLEMQGHLARKMALQLSSLARRASNEAELVDLGARFTSAFEALSETLEEAAQAARKG